MGKGDGRNKKVIAEYIRNQLEEDYAADQLSLTEYTDPFTGGYDYRNRRITKNSEKIVKN